MTCKKCGCALEDGRKICETCGKKRKKSLITTLITLTVVLTLLAVVIALCWPALNRFYRRNFMDATEYLKYVQTEALENDPMLDMAGSLYDMTQDWAAMLATPMEHTASVKGSDNLMALLNNVDKTNNTDLSWLNDAQLKVTTGADGLKLGAEMDLFVGETQLLNANVFFDALESKLYAGLPDVNQTYLTTQLDAEYMASFVAMLTAAGKNGDLPDGEAVEQLLRKYMALFVEQYADVQKSTQKVAINKFSKNCTVLTVEMSAEQVSGVLKAILEDARTDATAKALLQAYCDGLNELAKQSGNEDAATLTVDALIDAAIESLQNMESGMVIKTYVTNTEQICGYRVETVRGETIFEQLTLTKKTGWESVTRLSGGIEIRGKGDLAAHKLSGSFDINYSGQNYLQCKLEGVDTQKLETGLLRGKISVTFSETLTKQILTDLVGSTVAQLAGVALPTLEFNLGEESTDIRVLMAGSEYLNLSVTSKPIDEYKPQLPGKWVTANLQGLAKWLSGSTFTTVLDLMKAVNIPEGLITSLDKLISKWKVLAQFI